MKCEFGPWSLALEWQLSRYYQDLGCSFSACWVAHLPGPLTARSTHWCSNIQMTMRANKAKYKASNTGFLLGESQPWTLSMPACLTSRNLRQGAWKLTWPQHATEALNDMLWSLTRILHQNSNVWLLRGQQAGKHSLGKPLITARWFSRCILPWGFLTTLGKCLAAFATEMKMHRGAWVT